MPDAPEAIEPPEPSGPIRRPTVRDATPHDATACAAIYAPYVTDTAITFETEVPDVAVMAGRIEKAQRAHAWLVLEDATGTVVGYAYAGPFKERAAYRWSCEVSVYLAGDRRGRGGGRRLYEALLERLTARGYPVGAAGVTPPQQAGGRAHRGGGFEAGRTLPGNRLEMGRPAP